MGSDPGPAGLGVILIHWEAQVGNAASRAVAERVGFTIRPGTVPGHTGRKWAGYLLPVPSVRHSEPTSGRDKSWKKLPLGVNGSEPGVRWPSAEDLAHVPYKPTRAVGRC